MTIQNFEKLIEWLVFPTQTRLPKHRALDLREIVAIAKASPLVVRDAPSTFAAAEYVVRLLDRQEQKDFPHDELIEALNLLIPPIIGRNGEEKRWVNISRRLSNAARFVMPAQKVVIFALLSQIGETYPQETTSVRKKPPVNTTLRERAGKATARVYKKRGDEIDDFIDVIESEALKEKRVWVRIGEGDPSLDLGILCAAMDEITRVYNLDARSKEARNIRAIRRALEESGPRRG